MISFSVSMESWLQHVYRESVNNMPQSSEKMFQSSTVADGDQPGITKYAERFTAVNSWATSIYLLLTLQIISIGTSCIIVYQMLSRSSHRCQAIGLVVFFIACFIAYQLAARPSKNAYGANSIYKTPVTDDIISIAVKTTGIEKIHSRVRTASVLIPVCAMAFAFAFGSLLWSDPDVPTTADRQYARLSCGRFALGLFSATVVVGAIEMRLLFELPAPWVNDEKFVMAIQKLAIGASSAAGVKTSAMLILVCVPVLMELNRRIYREARIHADSDDLSTRIKWINTSGLAASSLGAAGTISSLLAPAFANTVFGSLSSALGKIAS